MHNQQDIQGKIYVHSDTCYLKLSIICIPEYFPEDIP